MRSRQILPSLMVCCSLILLYLSEFDVARVLAKDYSSNVHNQTNDPTIHISLVNSLQTATRTPSCVHSFAQIQIHNIHNSESLIVQDVQVLSSQNYGLEHLKSTIFGGRQVVIRPASTSYLPVTIFAAHMKRGTRQEIKRNVVPEWDAIRRFTGEEDNDLSLPSSSFQDISFGMAMDFADWLHQNPRDLGGYNVEIMNNSTIILKTNRGKYQTTLPSSHILLNPHGLPHTILFLEDGFVSDSDFIAAKVHHKTYTDRMTQAERDKISYEYDIYMDNPFEETLNLRQVYASRPDLITVLYEHPSGENHMDGKNSRFNNCGIYSYEREHCNLAQSSLITGPTRVKNGSKLTYIATVRLKEDVLIELKQTKQNFLGYLHLQFHNSFFSIGLEFKTLLSSEKIDIEVNRLNDDEISLGEKNVAFMKKSSPNPDADRMFHYNLSDSKCDEEINSSDILIDRLDVSRSSRLTKWNISFPLPHSDDNTSIIDLGTITPSAGGKMSIHISITNRSKKKIMIRRVFASSYVSETVNTSRGGALLQTANVSSDHNNIIAKLESSEQIIYIDPGETSENSLRLTFESDMTDLPRSLQGSVIFHIGAENPETSESTPTVPLNHFLNYSVVEIPWRMQIAKGHLEYDFKASIFPLNSHQISEDACGYVERNIALKNMFKEEIHLSNVYIKDETESGNDSIRSSFCLSHFLVVEFNDELTLAPRETMVMIKLRYAFKDDGILNSNLLTQSKKCLLVIETSSGTKFEMTLTVESGTIQAVVPQRITPKGRIGIAPWYQNDDQSSLKAQFLNLFPTNLVPSAHGSIDPILLDFGILSPNTIEMESMYLENYNSFPINITISYPSYDGISVRVGRSPFSFEHFMNDSFINGSSISKRISDEAGIHVSEKMLDFFREFQYRDDVKVLPSASESLQMLFNLYANMTVHKTNNDSLNKRAFFDLDMKNSILEKSENCCKILIWKTDKSNLTELMLPNDEPTHYQYMLPPGSITRLKVTLITPPKNLISQPSNLMELVTAGTVIQTSTQQIMPIIIKYTLFLGNISLSAPNSTTSIEEVERGILNIPIYHDRGTELFIQTDDNSSIKIVSLESCNDWFVISSGKEVSVQDKHMTNFAVRPLIHYASEMHFFDYALSWLKNYRAIRENRCIFDYDDFELELSGFEKTQIVKAKAETLVLLEKAVLLMGNLSATEGFFVTKEDYLLMEHTFTAWEKLNQFGLHVIQGGMQVHMILLNETESSDSIRLLKPLKDRILQMKLELPRFVPDVNLIGGELRFPSTALTQTRKIMIPIQNPTADFVKVRLMLHDPTEIYISSNASIVKHSSWWEGNGILTLYDERGYRMFSEPNAIPDSSPHATNAFSVGCTGRRCGYMAPNQSSSNENQIQVNQQRRSTIGASSTNDSELRGRIYSSHGIPDGSFDFPSIENNAEPFSVESNSLAELILTPHGKTQIGPIYFRPSSRRHFSTVVSIHNNITGLESFKVKGFGAAVKVVFLEKYEYSDDMEVRFGKSFLRFEGNNTSGQPRQMKSFYLANLGDMDVKILDMWLSHVKVLIEGESALSDFKHDLTSKCHKHNFYLIGCDSFPQSYNLPINQQKPIHISWIQDCSFESIYLSLFVEYESISTSPLKGIAELLLGYEMTKEEKNACRPSSFNAVKHRNEAKWWWIFTAPTFVIPLLVFFVVTIDMVTCARISNFSSHEFQKSMKIKKLKSGGSKKTGFKNWSSAYRCLSRADPNCQELMQLGQEQTRQMLLNTYKREYMISPQCILSNGTFSRQRYGAGVVSSSGSTVKQATSPRFSVAVSLCDAVFPKRRYIFLQEEHIPVVPCGLSWRIYNDVKNAMTRTDTKEKLLVEKETITVEVVENVPSSIPERRSAPPQAQLEKPTTFCVTVPKRRESITKNHLLSEDVDRDKSSNQVKEKNKTNTSVHVQSNIIALNDEAKRAKFHRDESSAPSKKNIEVKKLKGMTKPTFASSPLQVKEERTPIKEKRVIKAISHDISETSFQKTIESVQSSEIVENRHLKKNTSEIIVDDKIAPSVTLKDYIEIHTNKTYNEATQMEASIELEEIRADSTQVSDSVLLNTANSISSIHDDCLKLPYSTKSSPDHEAKAIGYSSLSYIQSSEHWSPKHGNISSSSSPIQLRRDHPPDLAPPPGFHNISNAFHNDDMNSSVVFEEGMNTMALEPIQSLNHAIHSQEENVVNSFNVNIDVMNFFDFLDESGDINATENLALDVPDHVAEDISFAPLLLGSGKNPWSDSHLSSNDENYKFKFDEEIMGLENQSSSRMFSSTLFLDHVNEDSEDQPAKRKSFDADAFFSGIFDADD